MCPSGFTYVSGGCYYFSLFSVKATWSEAEELCNNKSTSTALSHLVSLETESELSLISSWITGLPLAYDFWTGGHLQYTAATYITPEANVTYWKWSGQEGYLFGIMSLKNFMQLDGNAMYLKYNSTNMPEYRSDNTSSLKSYICEAQSKTFSIK